MKEELMQALANTVLGICTVICVLVIIALVIYCFKFIPMLQARFAKKTGETEPEPAQAAPPVFPPETADETDDLELVAVIAAAIAAGTGADPGSFTVRSIKRRI